MPGGSIAADDVHFRGSKGHANVVSAVVVHEAPKTAGFGAEVSAIIQEHCFLHLQAPVQRVTGFDTVMPYYKLENEYLPDATRITRSIRDCLAY